MARRDTLAGYPDFLPGITTQGLGRNPHFTLREMRTLAMQPKTATAKRGRTPEEIIAEQKRTHKQATPSVPAKATSDTPVVLPLPDTRTDVQKYLDEVAPANIVGRMIKFSKEGKFVFGDTDEEVAETVEFIALCDQTVVGWIKFYNDGETPPDRVMGLLYGGFTMPAGSPPAVLTRRTANHD